MIYWWYVSLMSIKVAVSISYIFFYYKISKYMRTCMTFTIFQKSFIYINSKRYKNCWSCERCGPSVSCLSCEFDFLISENVFWFKEMIFLIWYQKIDLFFKLPENMIFIKNSMKLMFLVVHPLCHSVRKLFRTCKCIINGEL